jgi:hypothetical protein
MGRERPSVDREPSPLVATRLEVPYP